MTFSDTSYNLRIELDTHNCELSAEEIEHFEEALNPLRKPVEKFPVSDLYITVTFQPRSNTYRVKMALVLPGRTLAAADVDEIVYTAFKRCVRKLTRRLKAYEADLENKDDRSKLQKGTHHELHPDQEPDTERLRQAIEEQDYTEFRKALAVYEELLRKRIGRWANRYPEIEARIGGDLAIDDLVEEVFLNAFERFEYKAEEVPLGDWLEHLIDPSIRLLAEHPTEELENIEFAKTLRDL